MILRSIGKQSDDILNSLQRQFGDKFYYSWNSFRNNFDWAFDSYKKSIDTNKSIMCAETPLIGRSLFDNNNPDTYYRIGINIVSSYLEQNFFLPKVYTTDRIEKILAQTNTNLLPWRTHGEHIIYAMQVPGDSSLLGLDVYAAAQYDLLFLRQLTNRPIIVSQHPDLKKKWGQKEFKKNKGSFDGFQKVIDITKAEITSEKTESLFDDAWCTVCHTSGIGFDSIANGIPVITLNERSFVRNISSASYYDIENPSTPDRIPHLSKIAYCQWSLQEVESGYFKKHYESLYNLTK